MEKINRKKNLAIIPARGGSKRIPKKNIRNFCGSPIIKYSIDAALRSDCFDEIMVSTDNQKIADLSIKFGAKVPFFRSKMNSNDFADIGAVVKEVIDSYFNNQNTYFDNICIILPTAPFIDEKKIYYGYKIIESNEAKAVITVVKNSYPIQRSLIINKKYIEMIWPQNYNKNSQDFEETFHDAGQFYWINYEAFKNEQKLFTSKTSYIELKDSEVQDIDTEEDWKVAEIKYRCLHGL